LTRLTSIAWRCLLAAGLTAGARQASAQCYAFSGLGVTYTPGPPTVDARTLGDPASMPGACPCGEPINAGTGNLFEQVTDYQSAGANKLAFTRYYNSMASSTTFATTLGANWRSNYDRYLRLSSTTVIAERPNGQQVTFSTNGGGVWTTDTDIDLALTNSGSTWTLTDSHDTVESYTATGTNQATLQTIKARNGYTQTLQYGSGNQLASVTDSYQRQLSFAYSGGQIHSVTTPDGLVLTFGYSSANLAVVGYSTSPPTTVTYLYENTALPSALTGVVDENGTRYTTWTYDSSGRALTSQHAGGAGLTTVAYNDTDGSRTVTNELGQQEVDKFTTLQGVPKLTEADRLASATIPAGKSSYTYDSNGYPASYTDWNGNVTNFVNDAHGQPTSITEAFGTPQARTTTVTYHSSLHLPVLIVTPGLTAAFTYDSSGELLTRALTDTAIAGTGLTRTWTYTWSNFLESSVKSPRTDVSALTKFTHDSTGALTGITNALNQTVQVTRHTQGGLPQSIVDLNGVVTNLTYDARQRLLSVAVTTAAGVLTNTYAYDAAGNLLTVTQPDGSWLTNTYDGAHRLTGIADKLGDSIAYTLDALGDRTQVTALDPAGNPQLKRSGVFDPLGRVLQSIGGASQTTSFSYDSNGNTLAVTDPLTHATRQSFDALNRQVTSTDAAGGLAAFAFDAHNRLTRVTDANGAVTSYSYDGFGDLIQQSSPAAGSITYRYDAGGNLTQKIDARGLTSNFTYDALNRVISTTYPANSSENVAYSYDQPGHGFGIARLTSVADAAGLLNRSYDERGNLLSETRTRGSIALTASYTYDAASRVASITYPSKWSVAYTRDGAGRITAAAAHAPGGSAQSIVSSVAYQPFGPVSALTYGNGIAEKRTFDLDYRLTGIASANVQNLNYGYDAADNLLSAADGISSANNQSLGYDALNRLASASGAYGSLGYTYDANGNRLTETSTASSDGLGSVSTLTYNQAGRLATVSTAQQPLTQYTYDAHGQRVIKVGSSTGTTIYQYDRSGHLLEETDGQGNAQVDYVYLYGRPVATIQLSGNKIYFLHGDRLGSPQIATDSTQTIAWSTGYQPFGQTAAPPTTITQDLRLPGQESDLETGLYHNGFRDYVPGWGRYLESDPIGLAGGLNTYAYVRDNPLGYTDPLGLCDSPATPPALGPSLCDDGYNPSDCAASLAAGSTGSYNVRVGTGYDYIGFYIPDVYGRSLSLDASIPTSDYEAMTPAQQIQFLINEFPTLPAGTIASFYKYLSVYDNRHPVASGGGIRG
jgi:RHS repeat-associated protein